MSYLETGKCQGYEARYQIDSTLLNSVFAIEVVVDSFTLNTTTYLIVNQMCQHLFKGFEDVHRNTENCIMSIAESLHCTAIGILKLQIKNKYKFKN